MTMTDRRQFLRGALGAACCAAAAPLITPVTVAAAPGENRMVVIVLRGAMDGLGVFSPYGDPGFAALRPTLAMTPETGLIDLDGRFGMHPALSPLAPLWAEGSLAVAHAVSTPYRDKRSHFDGQDILEAGTPGLEGARDGWLNRALGHMPRATADTVYAVGRSRMLITSGPNRTRSWAPGARVLMGEDADALLSTIYARDPLFAQAADDALRLAATGGEDAAAGKRAGAALGDYAAARLSEEARIAAFSLGGWDTHVRQPSALKAPLRQLADAILALRRGLGPHWSRTFVVAMTEFGRTARENGGRGTDHGTGGAALLAGGALAGARVHGDWPGLGPDQLYRGRDLAPTRDIRHYPAWALRRLYGLDRAAIERDVFPGLDMGSDSGFLA